MITWLSTKSPARMLDTPISQDVANYLRDNRGVDAAMLAVDLGLAPVHVQAFQRRLGLRKCVPPGRRKQS